MKLGAWQRQEQEKMRLAFGGGRGDGAIGEKDIRGFPWVTYPHVRDSFGG